MLLVQHILTVTQRGTGRPCEISSVSPLQLCPAPSLWFQTQVQLYVSAKTLSQKHFLQRDAEICFIR